MSDPAARQRPMINLDEFERRLGRPAAPSGRSGEDPLAELARLVGGTEDRYKTMFQGRPAASTAPYATERQHAQVPTASARRLGGDFAAIEAGLRSSIRTEFEAAPARALEPPAELAAPEVDSDDWLDAPYLPPAQASESPRSRLPLYATAAIIIAGMAGIGTSFALKRHSIAPREIAMIKAESGPTKIQAADTAAAPKPQDISVLENSQQVPVAAVSHSEEPANLSSAPHASAPPVTAPSPAPQAPTGAAQQAPAGRPEVASASPAAVVPVPPPPAAEGQGQTAFGLAGMIEPRKVKTVVVRPDGTIASGDASPTTAPQASSAVAGAQELPPVGPGPVPIDTTATTTPSPAPAKTSERAAQNDATTEHETPAPAAQAAPQQSERTRVAEASARDETRQADEDGSSFAVQLAAPQSEAAARQSMAKLQREYSSLLAGHRLKFHRATVANRSVYRVRVVGLSHAEATSLCEKLQAKGGSCFVARNN